ncbi:MAG: hypothetical protein NTV32_02105, partial [Gammaproteobacteria bacterium]|nr:hypothetical protein [Gammaproteobacteria bacterium]
MKIIGKIPFTLESKASHSRWARQSLVLGCSLDILKDPERLTMFHQEVTDAIQGCIQSHWARQSPLIYVMISGHESLPGFEAYFKRLKPEQREQILGFTLPFHQADLKAEFLALNQQLSVRVLSHLSSEASQSVDNAEVFFFPQALAEMYPILAGILSGFKMLRGVYFVTADSIKRIESDVLIKEAQYFKPWAVIFDYAETQRKKIAAIALTGLILLFGVWWMGALKGEDYLSEVTQNLNVSTLPDLQALNQLGVQDDRWFGRYLGILFPNKVKDAIQNQYDLELRSQFQPMLLAEFAQHLQNNITAGKTKKVTGMDLLTEDAAIYDSLSAYLMLNDLSHFDAHFVAGQIAEPDLLPVYWDWVALGVQSMPVNQDLVNQARAI